MSTEQETCTSCGEREPDDNDGWMEAPSGSVYCPGCFEHLFKGRAAPKVASQLLRAAIGGEDSDA